METEEQSPINIDVLQLQAMRNWEKVAPLYHTHLESGGDPFQDKVNTPALLNYLPFEENMIAADVGAGSGRFTKRLAHARPSWSIYASDISQTLLQYAKDRQIPNTELAHAASHNLAHLDNESCDYAIFKMVFPSLIDLKPTVLEARRILKPGGWMVISTLHPHYHEGYVAARYYDTLVFKGRNLAVVQATWPEISQEEIDKDLSLTSERINRDPYAIFTQVAGSSFYVPTYVHSLQEIEETMTGAGFARRHYDSLEPSADLLINHREWRDRAGMEIILNMVWEKQGVGDMIGAKFQQAHRARLSPNSF